MPTHGTSRVADFEELVREKTPKSLVDYYATGTGDEQTLEDSVKSFQRFRLRPRVLRSKENIEITTQLQGHQVSFPLGIAPTGFQRAAHPDGEKATARAAAKANVIMIFSSWAMMHLEEAAKAAPTAKLWMQVYPFKDRRVTSDMIKRAEKAVFRPLLLRSIHLLLGYIVGLSEPEWRVVNFGGVREDATKAKNSGDKYLFEYARLQTGSPGTWEYISWIKSITTLPVVLKGIVTDEGAREAVAAGVQGIIVSAHGGRQLDGIQAPIEALAEVVDATLGSGVEVYMDGGVRSGRDIFKALAIGAKAVFIGRPVIWGLLHNGENGVTEILQMLKKEFVNTMSLCGCSRIDEVDRSFIKHQSQLTCKL